MAGLVCGILSVVFALSSGTLLAHGELAGELGTMVAIALFSAGAMAVATAVLSPIIGQVTTVQAISTVAVVAVAGAAAGGFSGPRAGAGLLATTLVAIGLATALSGAAMWLLGRARLGRIIRFVPYPVFGGFLAITGWYLLRAGLEIVVSGPISFADLDRLAAPATLLKLGLAAAFVIAVEAGRRRWRSSLAVPAAVVFATVAFGAFTTLAEVPNDMLQRTGWLIPVPDARSVWPPIGLGDLAQVDWHAVLGAMLFAPTVVLVTTAAAIMNVSAIEIEIGEDFDVDRELRSMGLGNLLSGAFGGVPGFPSVATTLMAVRLGGSMRATGAIAGSVAFLGLAYTPQLLALIPAPLLGALLLWLGAPLLLDWVLRPSRGLQRGEYAIVLAILAVSIAAGFTAGILTGLVAALALFVVEYSRVASTRFIADGRDYHGELMPESYREALREHGHAIVVIKLSGFVFFGTGDRVVQEVTRRAAAGAGDLRFVIMDFRQVTGLDSSAVMSFARLRRFAEARGLTILLTGLGPTIRDRLFASGLALGGNGAIRIEPELDDALRWAAVKLLAEVAPELIVPGSAVGGGAVARLLGDATLAQEMYRFLERVEFPTGARIIEQGAFSDDMYFVEQGEGLVQLEPVGAAPVKLAAFASGTVLGEIAFYRSEPRSASVIARTPIVASKLSRATLARIEAEAPALARRFHEQMARVLAGRLQSANRLIRMLAD